jgi:hypothetical protein
LDPQRNPKKKKRSYKIIFATISQSFLKGCHNPITLTKYVGFFFCPLIFNVYINCDSFFLLACQNNLSTPHSVANPRVAEYLPKSYFDYHQAETLLRRMDKFLFSPVIGKKKVFRPAITLRKVELCTEGKIFT